MSVDRSSERRIVYTIYVYIYICIYLYIYMFIVYYVIERDRNERDALRISDSVTKFVILIMSAQICSDGTKLSSRYSRVCVA